MKPGNLKEIPPGGMFGMLSGSIVFVVSVKQVESLSYTVVTVLSPTGHLSLWACFV